MISLEQRCVRLLGNTQSRIKRYLYHSFPWDERLTCIKGLRGVGKSTMMLQYLKDRYDKNTDIALYATLDDLYFTQNNLIDLVDEFVARGGRHLFLDEVHKYPNWATELKNAYDYYPELKITFSASSLLEILNSRADLSRRALCYELKGLSFREFLALRHGQYFDAINIKDLLKNHVEIATEINKKTKPLRYFEEYLREGYFPFHEKDTEIYYKRLREIVNMTLDIELPQLRHIDLANLPKIKKLLFIISQSVPFTPNITSLSQKTDISRNSLTEYINALHDSRLITNIYKATHGIGILQKPDKIYLDNTNIQYAISHEHINIGHIRETFFLNQVSNHHNITYPQRGDFMVDEKWLFEVGGRNKTVQQIQHDKNGYLAMDQIDIGARNRIPLYLFGFLY